MRRRPSDPGLKCCCCCLLSVFAILIKGFVGLNFKSQPSTKSALVGSSVDFQCIVTNMSSDSRVEWWYLNQNLQLSCDSQQLNDDFMHFGVFNSITPDGEYENQVQISNVQRMDAGYYRCQVVSDSGVILQQINTLIITDDTDNLSATAASPANWQHANFTGCCIDEQVSETCLPICDPGSSELSYTRLTNCTSYILELLRCGSGQRNHVPCCAGKQVPDFCLDLCQGQVPLQLGSQLTQCAPHVQSMVDCFQEGYYLLPDPPTRVTVEPLSDTRAIVSWQMPSQTGNEELSFRVFYRASSSTAFRSTQLTKNSSKIVENLQPYLRYRFYVISVNVWGSSQPSYFIEMTSHFETLVTSSPNDFSLLDCCEEQQVTPMCRAFLCSGETAAADPDVDLLPCYSDIDKVFQCLSGMRNNTACCVRHGLSPRCYPLCNGLLSQMTIDNLDCFQEMGIISSCFLDGHENIPGHPSDVAVDSVTSTSAIVRWSPPNVGADRVEHYTVRYKQYTDLLFAVVSVDGRNHTLTGLLPSTLYEVAVVSVGNLGISLPSPAVVFQTYWERRSETTSSPLPLSVGTTLSPAESLTRCCENEAVSQNCLRFCSYSLLITTSDPADVLPCLAYMNQFLRCVTDGMNHTNCCTRRGVRPACLGYCSGETSAEQYDFDCLPDLSSMLNCFSEDVLVLPSMPIGLMVMNKTAYTIVLEWQPPSKNADLVTSYVVSYRQDNATLLWNLVTTRSTSFILQNLLPDTTYAVKVVAESEQGASLPTPELKSRTLPVDVRKKINITKDLTDCCREQNVSDPCLPVCAGSGEIGLAECGQDLGRIIECAADNQDHTPCCRRMNIPVHCLDFCRGVPRVDSFPNLICVSFIEQIFTCFHEDSGNLPNPPYQFSYTEIGPTYVILTWREPVQTATGVLYNLYYSSRSPNETYVIKGVQNPYRLINLRPLSRYDIYLVAVNSFGSSTPTVTLTILTSSDSSHQPRIQQDPEGFVAIGSPVTLRCFSAADATLSWLRLNRRTDGSILEIDSATENDTGRYTCIARGLNMDSVEVILRVQYAPFVSPRYQSVEVEANRDQMAHLECRFHGFPDAVQWQKPDGKLIWASQSNGSRYTTATYVMEDEGVVVAQLSVNQVVEDDLGWYACLGSNDYASVTGYVLLTDSNDTRRPEPPFLLPKIENVFNCCVQNNVSVGCVSACAFDVDLTSIVLNQLQCIPDLPKMVECSADGRNHSKCCADRRVPTQCLALCSGVVPVPFDVSCLAHVIEIIDCMEMGHGNLPSRPLSVKVTVDKVVSVTWLPPSVNPHLVQYYEVSYVSSLPQNTTVRQVTATSGVNVMELKNVTSFMRYEIRVTACNHHGSSVPSDPVYFTTLEPPPSSPTNVTALSVDPVTIEVSWAHPQLNWQSVALYYIYFSAEHLDGNWSKVTVGQSVFQTQLNGLRARTVYRAYVTAVSSHFESKPSDAVEILTLSPDSGHAKSQVNLGIGLFFLFFILVLLITAVICWCIRFLRRRHHSEFKESVSFENPTYASMGDGQIRLPIIDDATAKHSNDHKAGKGSNSSGESVFLDDVILRETNCSHDFGYTTIPTSDRHSGSGVPPPAADGKDADSSSC